MRLSISMPMRTQTAKKRKEKLVPLPVFLRFVNQYVCLMLYKSLLLPHIDYGDIIYMHTSKRNLDKLQVIRLI